MKLLFIFITLCLVYVCYGQNAALEPSVFVRPKFLNLDFNAKANITCTTYGNNAKVEWLRNQNVGGQLKLELVPSEKIFASSSITPQGNIEKIWTLILKNVTVKDAGNYWCKVTLDGKPAFSELDVAVRAPLSPQIKQFPSKVTKEDAKITLKCRNRGAPRPAIKFYKDGVELTSRSNGYNISDKTLSINKPKYPDHDGLYTCSVSNMFGKATGEAKLTVTVSPIIDKSKKIVVVGGSEKLEVNCKIKRSNPIPKITWEFQPWPCRPEKGYNCNALSKKWTKADPGKYDIKPSNTDVTMTSTFKVDDTKGDATKFFIRCTAEHEYGKDSHEVIGIIDQRDAKNLLKSEPEKIETDEQKSFTLTCTGQAGLFLKLSWKKDNVPITANNSTITIKEKGSILQLQVSTLTITNLTPAQSGFYTCTAEPARAQDDPVVIGSDVKVNKIYAPNISSISSPAVVDGETAIITCDVNSHPAAAVKWFKDNIVLNDIGQLSDIKDCKNSEKGKYFRVTERNTNSLGPKIHQLIVCKTAWKLNNGTFTCSALNALGNAKQDADLHINASPTMIYQQVDEYAKPGHSYSRNCSCEGNPTPYVWWVKESNGAFKAVTDNSTNGFSYLNFSNVQEKNYGTYRCIAANKLGVVYDEMMLKRPLVTASKYKPDNAAATASLVAALIAAVFIIVIISILAVILYKRKQLYGGFYILSIPPSPDYFRKLDPTKPISEQVHKLPYFPEWEFPRSKVRLKDCVGAGAFGEVYIADAIGIAAFDPRYKISLKHKPLFSKKRFSLRNFQRSSASTTTSMLSRIDRQDSIASTRSSRSTKSYNKERSQTSTVAVKKLKEDATTVEYKDLISEMKILIHIGLHENIVNMLGACTKGVEKDTMVILEFCPHGNLLSFMKERRQVFKPIWSKQHIGMEKEFTTFDLCVAAYQIAKGLDYLASRKCVHRDVAARNVLVGDNYVMKIADFGLARDVCEDERYVKVSGGLLPVKWMAIESIFDRVFTHQSDVWSYGVLLWELMTLGGSPYPGLHAKDLPEFLRTGSRMDQPQFCPNEIYNLARECWNERPVHRPQFSDIVLRLARVIEAHCKPEEITLYLDRCHISGGSFSFNDDDYLKPVDSEVGSYHFSPPPSYSQSLYDHSVESNKALDDVFKRKSSERYVPDNRFNDDDVASSSDKTDDYEQAVDSCRCSDRSIEPKAKFDEIVNEKDASPSVSIEISNTDENDGDGNDEDDRNNNSELAQLYVNDRLRSPTPQLSSKEQRAGSIDEDKDIDENSALLTYRTPSPIEELSNYLNQEFERMDAEEGYVNA